MVVTSTAAAVGAYLTLLQSGCLDTVRCAETAARLVPSQGSTGSSQQKQTFQSCCSQQPQQQQQAPASISQACLLRGMWAPSSGKQHRPSQHQQLLLLCQHHHPWQQLWPSQWRSVCSSAAVCSSSRGSPPTWPGAVPPLHQPSKHVTGTHPLKVQPIRGAPEAAAAAEQIAALGETTAVLPAQESVFMRHRAKFNALVRLVQFVSTCTLVPVLAGHIVTSALPGQLSCGDAVVQKIGLSRLQSVLSWRPVFGEGLVWALMQRHVLAALVQLLQAGTDAVVVVETCEIIKGLLDSPLALAAMQQAGLSEAVNMGLKEGWIPTGALQSARGLQKRLSLMSS